MQVERPAWKRRRNWEEVMRTAVGTARSVSETGRNLRALPLASLRTLAKGEGMVVCGKSGTDVKM